MQVIDHGDLAIRAGVSVAPDLALHLVARLAGHDLATATARQTDHTWPRPPRGH